MYLVDILLLAIAPMSRFGVCAFAFFPTLTFDKWIHSPAKSRGIFINQRLAGERGFFSLDTPTQVPNLIWPTTNVLMRTMLDCSEYKQMYVEFRCHVNKRFVSKSRAATNLSNAPFHYNGMKAARIAIEHLIFY